MILPALSSIAEMFGLFAIGWVAHLSRILDRGDVDRIARLVLDVLLPCLIFSSIVGDLDRGRLGELWLLPLLGFGMMALGYTAGIFLRRGLRSDDRDVARVFHHMCAVNNYGFLPIFIIQNSMSADALALFFVFNLGSVVGYWTLGVFSLGDQNLRSAARKLLSPPLISLVVALAVALAGGRDWLPGFALRITERAGGIAVPLILITIGTAFAGDLRREFARDIAYLCLVRLVLLPAAIIGLLSLIPLAEDVRTICIIVAIMPATATATILTRIYGGSSAFAATGTLATTLASALTIPAWVLLLFS